MTQGRNQVRVVMTISDERWPELTAIGERSGTCGTPAATTDRQQYDLAYSKFENVLHNLLRPAVDSLIAKRKGK